MTWAQWGWRWKGYEGIGDLCRYRGALKGINLSVVWKRGDIVACRGKGAGPRGNYK